MFLRGPFLEVLEKVYCGGMARILKTFLRLCVKCIKDMKLFEESFRKGQNFHVNFQVLAHGVWINKKYYIDIGSILGCGWLSIPKLRKYSINLSKISIRKLPSLRDFQDSKIKSLANLFTSKTITKLPVSFYGVGRGSPNLPATSNDFS